MSTSDNIFKIIATFDYVKYVYSAININKYVVLVCALRLQAGSNKKLMIKSSMIEKCFEFFCDRWFV